VSLRAGAGQGPLNWLKPMGQPNCTRCLSIPRPFPSPTRFPCTQQEEKQGYLHYTNSGFSWNFCRHSGQTVMSSCAAHPAPAWTGTCRRSDPSPSPPWCLRPGSAGLASETVSGGWGSRPACCGLSYWQCFLPALEDSGTCLNHRRGCSVGY